MAHDPPKNPRSSETPESSDSMDIHRGPAPRAQTASSPGTAAKQTQAGTSSAVNVKPTQPGTTSAHASAPDPNLPAGLYEHLITELLQQRLEALPPDHFYIQQQPVDPAEAARYLTGHLSQLIRFALNEVPTSQRPLAQIELANTIIRLIAREIDTVDL
jgi:hypothetical protein